MVRVIAFSVVGSISNYYTGHAHFLMSGILLCPETFKRYFLKSKDAKAILNGLSGSFRAYVGQVLNDKTGVEVVEADFGRVFLIDGKPMLFESGKRVFPTLKFETFLVHAARAVVDMGAVAHVCGGADVMAPGIVRYEGNFEKGDFVVVVDVRYGKPLLLGETLVDSVSARKMAHGAVVRNVHFVGDKVWNFMREFSGS